MFVENLICSAIFIRTKFWVSKKKHFFFFPFKNLHTKFTFFPTKSYNFSFRWDFLLKSFALESLRAHNFVGKKLLIQWYFYQDEILIFRKSPNFNKILQNGSVYRIWKNRLRKAFCFLFLLLKRCNVVVTLTGI